jgi:hypothetical protein
MRKQIESRTNKALKTKANGRNIECHGEGFYKAIDGR